MKSIFIIFPIYYISCCGVFLQNKKLKSCPGGNSSVSLPERNSLKFNFNLITSVTDYSDQPRMKSTQKFCFSPDDFQDGSLPESQDRWGAGYLVELVDPLFSGLSLVCGGTVRVDVVRVDVERHQTQGLEGGREH